MYAAKAALAVTPCDLAFNEETAPDNPFVSRNPGITDSEIRKRATKEFNEMVRRLEREGIRVYTFNRSDYRDLKDMSWPDAVFPNWWLTDTNNQVWFMPMSCPSRNAEKALASFVLETLMPDYHIDQVTNFASDCDTNRSLEGIGSLVIDRYKRRVFSTLSRRSDASLCRRWAAEAGYEPIIFETSNSQKEAFYHTDLMLALGDKFAVVCREALLPKYRERVMELLQEDREIIEISIKQAEDHYCGNIMQMRNERDERFIIMSESAYIGFTNEQKQALQKYGKIIACPLYTIEKIGGGSLHCVVQEIFLNRKVHSPAKTNGNATTVNGNVLINGY